MNIRQTYRMIYGRPERSVSVCAVLLLLMLHSCANIGTPDGGLYDETPPRIIHTSPHQGARDITPKKVTLEFNEYIKLENAYERVVISPPQFEAPDIEAYGKKVTVTFNDTLKPNFTYTIDFGSSIVDNNEGNPMGEYVFSFSTGGDIDTLQVSGKVLEAENLEPIKGMLVGLYRVESDSNAVENIFNWSDSASIAADSIFQTRALERIGRTDGSGHFIVKGVAPGSYRIFALNDQDQTYTYSQRSEKLAFTKQIITPYARYETRMDTVWHDSIHYDSIFPVKYTHFYPDDVVLLAFTAKQDDRYLLKSERPEQRFFSLYFTSKSDTLPRMTPLNFTAGDSTIIVETVPTNDTIKYWITDSLIYTMDTLVVQVDYYATDSLKQLSVRSDTLSLVSKISKERMEKLREKAEEEWAKEYKSRIKSERRAKQAEEERAEREAEEEERKAAEAEGRKYEKKKKEKKKRTKEEDEIVVPPMPMEPYDIRWTSTTGLAPNKNIDLTFEEPIAYMDASKVSFTMKVDSLFELAPYLLVPVEGTVNAYRFYAEWEPDSTYMLTLDSAAFVSVYGKATEATKRNIKVRGLNSFSTLFVTLQNADTSAIVQLLNSQDKVIRSAHVENGKADFYFLQPQTYYMRTFFDRNGNGEWDTGDYDTRQQPEEVFYYHSPMQLRAQWDVNQTWNLKSKPLTEQKPEKITKQKPDKSKQIQHRNAEKLAERARRKKKN
ncbi:MAG: Ig-like domain-containing protein [Bacteroidaceae bacterium]|nr:Ig-like domain-containing protein [Bacteroidaceae bacterium]